MTLHVIYSNATGTTQDLAALDAIRLASPMDGGEQGVSLTANAEEGSVAISTLLVDDPGGTLNLVGHRRVYVYESAEDPLNQMIWTGFLGDRTVTRGEGEFVLSADRRWSAALVEGNTILSRRIITGADGNRPAETDVARVTWLVASSYLSTVDNALGYLDTSGPIAMEAADLRGQTAFDVVNDCANRSGKNWFLIYHGDTSPPSYIGTYSIWYASAESSSYVSTLRLTNVLADVDNSTTFAVNPDVTLRRDPSRVYSGVYLPYEGGVLYQQDTATKNAYAARDTAAPNANVEDSTKAAALARRYLDDAATEDDRIDFRIVVPKEKVNHLREGHRVEVKFSHLPGYSSAYGWARLLRRTVTQLSDELYEIAGELSGAGTSLSGTLDVLGDVIQGYAPNGSSTESMIMKPATQYNWTVSVARLSGTAGGYAFTWTVMDAALLEAIATGPGLTSFAEGVKWYATWEVAGASGTQDATCTGAPWEDDAGSIVGARPGICGAVDTVNCGRVSGVFTTRTAAQFDFTQPVHFAAYQAIGPHDGVTTYRWTFRITEA